MPAGSWTPWSRLSAGAARSVADERPWHAVCLDQTHRTLGRGWRRVLVGSVSDSYDNALAETIVGLYKAEAIHRRGPWRTFKAVECATLERVDWFNNRRILEPIGYMPPAEAERRY